MNSLELVFGFDLFGNYIENVDLLGHFCTSYNLVRVHLFFALQLQLQVVPLLGAPGITILMDEVRDSLAIAGGLGFERRDNPQSPTLI